MSAYINKAILYYHKHEMGESPEAHQVTDNSVEITEIKQMLAHLIGVCSTGGNITLEQTPSKEERESNNDFLAEMLSADIDNYV